MWQLQSKQPAVVFESNSPVQDSPSKYYMTPEPFSPGLEEDAIPLP